MGSSKLNVTLQKITRDNFYDVIDLELDEGQEKNLPSNLFSIAESTLSSTFHPRAICQDGRVVGFVMYQFGEIGDFDEDECTIWRLMMGLEYQNKGIGKIAMGLVLAEIRAHQRCSLIDIYYDPKNLAARKLYARYGFKEVGFRDDGDIIAEVKA